MTAALSSDVREFGWRIAQGTQQALAIPILDDEGQARPVDDWTVDAKIKAEPGGTVLYTWPAEHIAIDGSDVTLLIPAPVSEAWVWTTGWYRVKLLGPDSDPDNPVVSRVLQGSFVLDLD